MIPEVGGTVESPVNQVVDSGRHQGISDTRAGLHNAGSEGSPPFPDDGVIAPLIIPKQSAPVSEERMIPKKTRRFHMLPQNGVAISPAAMRPIPQSITNALDLLRASAPNKGWVAPYIICPTAMTKLTEA